MVCEPQEIPGSPELRAHRGMVLSASNILAILEKDGVLERAFSLYPVRHCPTSANRQVTRLLLVTYPFQEHFKGVFEGHFLNILTSRTF